MYLLTLSLSSFILVAFGQPAWNSLLGLLAAMGGYALFWAALLFVQGVKRRFLLASAWFTGVQLIQLSWMTSHEFVGSGILIAYVVFALGTGVQFGALSLLVRRVTLSKTLAILAIPSLWALMEWVRQFFLSGYMWNPVGLSLSGSLYPMQLAAVVGVFGLSFWVILSNVLLLRCWLLRERFVGTLWALVVIFPYAFGGAHITYHQKSAHQGAVEAILVQTAQVPTAELKLRGQELVQHAFDEWCAILYNLRQQGMEAVDLIALPESVVPFMAYQAVYPLQSVREAMADIFGQDALLVLPESDSSLVKVYCDGEEHFEVVSNAFWAQSIANIYGSDVVAGLQDLDDDGQVYQAALHFQPEASEQKRYAKRVLVPIGEYIFDDPLGWCRHVAALHGLHSSFTAGTQATVFRGRCIKSVGVSICYEEIFGDLMRENRMQGAELLLNITNDGWYPRSRLPQQHFDHARLRSVECGIPLLRACTTGVTAAVDSLGRVVAKLGEDSMSRQELAGALRVRVPSYSYATLYSRCGDGLIVGLSLILAFLAFRYRAFAQALN